MSINRFPSVVQQPLPNDATKYLDGTGKYSIPAGTGGSGAVIQIVNTQTGTMASGTTQIPADSTIPQNSEGDEYMTLAITPTDAANILRIEAWGYFSPGTSNVHITMPLFQDSGADAIAVAAQGVTGTGSNRFYILTLSHWMIAGTTSSTTFKIRAGMNSAGTTTFNGISAAGPYYGNLLTSGITISEIVP